MQRQQQFAQCNEQKAAAAKEENLNKPATDDTPENCDMNDERIEFNRRYPVALLESILDR